MAAADVPDHEFVGRKREAVFGRSRIYQNRILLKKKLVKEEESSKELREFIRKVWSKQRNKTVRKVYALYCDLDERTVNSNIAQIPMKIISAAGKLSMMGAFLFPPVVLPALIGSLTLDSACSIESATVAAFTNSTCQKIEKVLTADDEVTKEFKKRVEDYNLVLTDLQEEIKKFYHATIKGAFDEDSKISEEVKTFVKEVKMIGQLDFSGMSSFLRAFSILCPEVKNLTLRMWNIWRQIYSFFKQNPAIGDSITYAAEVGIQAVSLGVVGAVAKSVGTTSAKAIKGVTGGVAGINLVMAGLDVKDIIINSINISNLNNGESITPLSKQLRALKNKLVEELQQIEETLEKSETSLNS